MKQKYDIFVSYRRTSFDSANLIATRLRAKGYRVFFDVESLRSGQFNVQLLDVIADCKDFLLILPENALDRCENQDDWLRIEILCAMEKKKNIIPVMLSGFNWPEVMPKGMDGLNLYQSVTASSIEYFDLTIERLCRRYLKSSRRIVRLLNVISVALLSLISLFALCYFSLRSLSVPLVNEIGTEMVDNLYTIDIMGNRYAELNKDWENFEKSLEAGCPDSLLFESVRILYKIDSFMSYLYESCPQDTLQRELGFVETLMLKSRGIDIIDIKLEPITLSSLTFQISDNISMMKMQFSDSCYGYIHNKINFDIYQSMSKVALINYAEELSHMSSEVKDIYSECTPKFSFLPKDIPLTLTSEEYDRKNEIEINRIVQLFDNTEAIDAELQNMSQKQKNNLANINELFSRAWKLYQTRSEL